MSAALVSALVKHAANIREEKESLGLEAILSVVLWISSDEQVPTPAIGFDQDVIEFLSAIGATIDIDTYRN